MYLRENAITLLESVSGVDVNTTTKQTLFTVPVGKVAIITHIIVRNASVNLNTANGGFGFDAGGSDVVAHEAYAELDGATKVKVFKADKGSVRGAAADILGSKCTTAQGAAATVDIDVFGYLFDA